MKALGFAGTSRSYRGGVVLPPHTDAIPGVQELAGLKGGGDRRTRSGWHVPVPPG